MATGFVSLKVGAGLTTLGDVCIKIHSGTQMPAYATSGPCDARQGAGWF